MPTPDSSHNPRPDPLDRLEHALEAWLQLDGADGADPDTVLDRQTPEVRELLEPMIAARVVDEPESVGSGDRIGEFRLRGELGRGGMGVVYEATDLRLERTVALKVVALDDLDSATTRQRFQREAAAAARLTHPGICQIFGTGDVGDRLWISMERLPGGTLAERMRPGSAGLPGEGRDGRVAAAVALVAELADTVDFAHRHHVVHRDIKPANVLFGADDRPRLVDFGVAKLLDRAGLSRTGDFAGSLAYASPEQLVGAKAIDGGTDIWSLGVVAYELITGRRPFVGDGHEALVRAILSREPDPIDAPADLVTILRCALEKERQHRYATAADLAEDLRRFLRREPIAAEPPGTVSRLVRFVRRRRTAVLVTLGLVAMASVAGWALWQNSHRSEVLGKKVEKAKASAQEAKARVQKSDARLARLRSLIGTWRVASNPGVIKERRRQVEGMVRAAERDLAIDPTNAGLRRLVAGSHEQAAVLYQLIKATDAAIAAHSRSIELLTPMVGSPSQDHVALGDLSSSYHNRHVLYRALGRHGLADKDLGLAIENWTALLESGPAELREFTVGRLALALTNRARRALGSAAAETDLARAESLWAQIDVRVGVDPKLDAMVAHRLQTFVVTARHGVAAGEPDRVSAATEQLIARQAALSSRHRQLRAVVSLEAEVRELRATIRQRAGDTEGAEADLRAAVAGLERLAMDGTADNRSSFMRARVLLLAHLDRVRKTSELDALLPSALVDARALVADHPLPLCQGFLSTVLLLRSERQAAAGAKAEAEALLREATELEAGIGSAHDFVTAAAHARYAQLLVESGDNDRAIEVATAAFRLVLGRLEAQAGSRQPVGIVRYRAQQLLRMLDRARLLPAMIEVADALYGSAPDQLPIADVALLALDRVALHGSKEGGVRRELVSGAVRRATAWIDALEAMDPRWQNGIRRDRLRWLTKHAELGVRLQPATADQTKKR